MSLQCYNLVKIIYNSLNYIKLKEFVFSSRLSFYQNTTLHLQKLENKKLIFIEFSYSFNRFGNIITGSYIITVIS